MKRRIFMLGVDCLGSELLDSDSLAELPNLRRLVQTGLSGVLESTVPPITVPAWTSMLTGRDPGELGVYGFRNRRSYNYFDFVRASSAMVRYPRIWDHVGAVGRRSLVVGVPQTTPPPQILGELVSGFEAEGSSCQTTYPKALAEEIAHVVGDYAFDVDAFRSTLRDDVLKKIYTMTERRFDFMEHLLKSRHWDFAMVCEIGSDRLHHCFWSDHDASHPQYDPASPHRRTIRNFYKYLDERLGRLMTFLDGDTTMLVVSDHGAKAMHGGICINEILRKAGWLTLKEHPSTPIPLREELVDWSRTRAWSEGGYYARIFLNIEGREPHGTLDIKQRETARGELVALLSSLQLPDGTVINNQIEWPERIYRRVRGLPPDLLVFFGELHWRSLGSVGHKEICHIGNDTGVDMANHSKDGLFVLAGAGVTGTRRASILDIIPTALQWMGLPPPGDITGRSLLWQNN